MGELRVVSAEAVRGFARGIFEGVCCEDYGVTVLQGASSWGAHESGELLIPRLGSSALRMRVAHDGRNAPYALANLEDSAAGREPCADEGTSLMLSLTDEKDYLACAWACQKSESHLLGVGVDLASVSDFRDRPSSARFIQLLFSEREHELAPTLFDGDAFLGYAALFAAKEASFKAMARPLRAWYRAHDDKLSFEVRHFLAGDIGLERGEGRDCAAQHAMDVMGIDRIEWHATLVEGMALVVACALGA